MASKRTKSAKFKIGNKVWRIQFASNNRITILPGIVTAIRSGISFDVYGYDYFLDNTHNLAHWEADLFATEEEAAAKLITIWKGNNIGISLDINGITWAKGLLYLKKTCKAN